MKKEEFKAWLDIALAGKSAKYRKDIVSRAGRVENAFKEIKPNFSLDKEYKKDAGEKVKQMLKCWGKDLEGTGIRLPIKTNQMNAITLSANWYFKFLNETEAKK